MRLQGRLGKEPTRRHLAPPPALHPLLHLGPPQPRPQACVPFPGLPPPPFCLSPSPKPCTPLPWPWAPRGLAQTEFLDSGQAAGRWVSAAQGEAPQPRAPAP